MNPRINWLILVNCMIGIFLVGFASRIFVISLPSVAKGLDTDMLGISWALIAYEVAGIGLGVVFGRLGDIYNRYKIYGLGIIIITVGSFLCGVSQHIIHLILSRFLQGVGGAIIFPSGRALAMEAMPEGSEGKAQGMMSMSHQFGFFLGPPIGGLIIDLIGWRGTFFFIAIIGLVGVALAYAAKGRGEAVSSTRRAPVDYLGATFFVVLALMVTLLLDRKIGEILGRGNKPLLAFALVATLWGFLTHESRTPSPVMNPRFFKVRIFAFGATGLLAVCFTQGLTAFLMPFYLQEILQLSPTFMGILFLAPSVFSLVGAPLSGHVADRIGPRIPMLIGASFLGIAFLIGTMVGKESHWLLPAAVLGLLGLGYAFHNNPIQAAMTIALPKEHWGSAVGIIHTIFGFGHILGISVASVLLTLAFQYYSGIPDATPDPGNPSAFVFSINLMFAVALGMTLIAMGTALTYRGAMRRALGTENL